MGGMQAPSEPASHVSLAARGSDGEPVLSVIGLTRAYEGRPVLRGVTLEVGLGERIALVGPSGSGKTTLLNCVGGVDRPDSGSIRIRTQSLEQLDANALAAVRRRWIGTVFQFFHL